MAYIIGALSEEEEATLVKRGWEVEDPPQELVPAPEPGEEPMRIRMVWVDASMIDIMSGPDWDTDETTDPGETPACV